MSDAPLPNPSTETANAPAAMVTLEPPLAETLRSGLAQVPIDAPRDDFNRRVVAAMQSGRDFEAWPRQVRTRLTWMLPPLIFGFAITFGIAQSVARSLPPPEPPAPIVRAAPAPPMPPLPAHLIEPARHTELKTERK